MSLSDINENVYLFFTIVGLILTIIAIVGGGINFKNLTIPPIETSRKIIIAILGGSLFTFGAYNRFYKSEIIYELGESITDVHKITLTKFTIKSDAHIIKVGSSVNINFELKNNGEQPVTLFKGIGLFVGSRSPSKENKGHQHIHSETILKVNTSIKLNSKLVITEKGLWKFWPCYAITTSTLEPRYCDDEWAVQAILAE